MYVKRNISWKVVLSFAWRNVLFFAIYGFLVAFIHHNLSHKGINIAIPFLPISTIGIAVAFYVGFKNNQSYDRFWEGRKIWGGIVNYSRTWGNAVLSFVTLKHTNGDISKAEMEQHHKILIYRHLAWINALRLQLRRPSIFSINYKKGSSKFYLGAPGTEEWKKCVGCFLEHEENEDLKSRKNVATQLVRNQGRHLKKLEELGLIEDFRHMELMGYLEESYNLQGKCERIKNTPLPRQYAYFSGLFVWAFILLMPFGLVGEFASMGHDTIWLMIPIYVLVSWIFITMEVVGDNSEDPFENFVNDVPMTALCRTIEIDLKDMLDEENLPEKIKPKNNILM
jgi:putative membrane protein